MNMDQWQHHIKPFLEDRPLSNSLYNYYLADEGRCVRMLIRDATPTEAQREVIRGIASQLVAAARKNRGKGSALTRL